MKFACDPKSNNAFILILLISIVSLIRDVADVALQLWGLFLVQELIAELKLRLRLCSLMQYLVLPPN
jgi:hypothetical protein